MVLAFRSKVNKLYCLKQKLKEKLERVSSEPAHIQRIYLYQ